MANSIEAGRIRTVTAPAEWASALVNGDFSGLSGEAHYERRDRLRCKAFARLLRRQGFEIVDVAREDGEAKDPRFTWQYRRHGGIADGGEVLDYVAIRRQ